MLHVSVVPTAPVHSCGRTILTFGGSPSPCGGVCHLLGDEQQSKEQVLELLCRYRILRTCCLLDKKEAAHSVGQAVDDRQCPAGWPGCCRSEQHNIGPQHAQATQVHEHTS